MDATDINDPDPADRRLFELDDDAFDRLIAMLDEPPRPCPLLAELFARPSALDS